jgi:GTP cyclohydrolase II
MNASAELLNELTAGSHTASQRVLAEFRCGRPVVVKAKNETVVASPVDACNGSKLEILRRACKGELHLAVTKRRARALGIALEEDVKIRLHPGATLEHILSLSAACGPCCEGQFEAGPAGAAATAAIDLAKLSGRLPAVLVFVAEHVEYPHDLFTVESGAISTFRQWLVQTLNRVASSTIPVEGSGEAEFVLFQDAIATPHVALLLGQPDPSKPVLVRVHSRCLTGDVFGSQRCDCGDQLRLASHLMRGSGGIILYLDQEGRGLGLANKIRAYSLQDAGLDTIEANMALGFENDEREYSIAGRLLGLLGFRRIQLLTNNPDKVAGLEGTGVEVCGSMTLQVPVTSRNRHYLRTMAERAGHRLRFSDEAAPAEA